MKYTSPYSSLKNWILCTNPLRNLTKPQIDQLLDQARRGNDIRLQLAFSLMEKTTPIYSICIQKRLAGIIQRNWTINPDDDSPEAQKQADDVLKIFKKSDAKNKDGFTEALRHLGLATFRGRSCVKPFIDGDGLRWKCLNNWNVLEKNGRLYWNQNESDFIVADEIEKILPEIPNGEVCYFVENLPIDIPGLQIYLRQLVGEETWSRYLEKSGVPQVLITAPEGTTDSQLDVWQQRAERIVEGGSGVLPFGANVNQLNGSRGQDPFTSFIQHQMRMIAIMSIGSTSSVLGDVGSGLGSDVATKQDEQFQSLLTFDCKRIANTISEVAVEKVRKYLGYSKTLCRFEFTEDEATTPAEYIEMATQLKALGVNIDVNKLKQLTGLEFIDTESWSPDVSNGWTRKDALEAKEERENA